MQFFDLVAQVRDVAIVVDHVVGHGQTRGTRRLGREHAQSLLAIGAITSHEPRELKIGVAVDHQHAIETRGARGFDEQRYRDDDVRAGAQLRNARR